jgi:hypothetical protein
MVKLVERAGEDRQILEAVAKVTAQFGHKAFMSAARKGEDAAPLWKSLAEQGFIGISIPEAYGGAGQGVSALSLILEETAAQGCPMMNMVAFSVYVSVLIKHGSEAQKMYWLPRLASGQARMAFAVTEPNAGTNTSNLQTRAVREGDDWCLSGTKYYITGVDVAEGILVVARTGENPKTGRGLLSLFIVPVDAPGLTRTPIPTEINTPDRQYTLFFDNVRLKNEALVGKEGDGLKVVFSGLNAERIIVASLCNGMARYAIERACEYARTRKVWNAPIGTHQAIAHPLAEAYARLQASLLLTQRAADIYDSGQDAGEPSNIAKFIAADMAVFALDRAIQTHGGNGMAQEYGLADLWFIARVQQIAPVSREMTLNYFAQHSLNLGRSY